MYLHTWQVEFLHFLNCFQGGCRQWFQETPALHFGNPSPKGKSRWNKVVHLNQSNTNKLNFNLHHFIFASFCVVTIPENLKRVLHNISGRDALKHPDLSCWLLLSFKDRGPRSQIYSFHRDDEKPTIEHFHVELTIHALLMCWYHLYVNGAHILKSATTRLVFAFN